MPLTTFLGILLASGLTLALFSRAYGPNAFFDGASHLLLGLGAGYVAAIILRQVLAPAFTPAAFSSFAEGGALLAAALLALLLALRFAPKAALRAWGLPPLGVLAGVAAALALAGAMRGSLLPQLMAVGSLHFTPRLPALDVVNALAATLTSLGVLLYLLPGSQAEQAAIGGSRWIKWLLAGWRMFGYWALMLALGALLASTAGARLTLLIDRVQWLLGLWF